MPLDQALKISQMIDDKFPEIHIEIDPCSEVLEELQLSSTNDEKILVVLGIPYGYCPVDFYKEFCDTLNKESDKTITIEKEI